MNKNDKKKAQEFSDELRDEATIFFAKFAEKHGMQFDSAICSATFSIKDGVSTGAAFAALDEDNSHEHVQHSSQFTRLAKASHGCAEVIQLLQDQISSKDFNLSESDEKNEQNEVDCHDERNLLKKKTVAQVSGRRPVKASWYDEDGFEERKNFQKKLRGESNEDFCEFS